MEGALQNFCQSEYAPQRNEVVGSHIHLHFSLCDDRATDGPLAALRSVLFMQQTPLSHDYLPAWSTWPE